MDTMDKLVAVGQLERLKDSLGGGSSIETETVRITGPSYSSSDVVSIKYLSGGSVETRNLASSPQSCHIDSLTPAIISSFNGTAFMMSVDGDAFVSPQGHANKFLLVAYGTATIDAYFDGA